MIKKERDNLCIGLFLHWDKINGVIELFAVISVWRIEKNMPKIRKK